MRHLIPVSAIILFLVACQGADKHSKESQKSENKTLEQGDSAQFDTNRRSFKVLNNKSKDWPDFLFGRGPDSLTDSIRFHAKSSPEVKLLDYRIVEREDISYRGMPRMVYRVVLNIKGTPSQADIRETAEAIWRDGNKHWSIFTVFIYLPGMDTSLTAYAVAEFGANGLSKFEITGFSDLK